MGDTNVLSAQGQKKADDEAAFTGASAADLLHTKTGAAQGSNEGGFYSSKDGKTKTYAKFYGDPDQAHSEHLANQIYNDLGIKSPASTVVPAANNKTAYVSKLMDNSGTLGKVGVTKGLAQHALGGVAADILTANWDAAGLHHDNLLASADGKSTMHVDNGGALLYKATGAKKADRYLPGISEWDKYSDPAANPSYAKLFKSAGIASTDDVPNIGKQIGSYHGPIG